MSRWMPELFRDENTMESTVTEPLSICASDKQGRASYLPRKKVFRTLLMSIIQGQQKLLQISQAKGTCIYSSW